MEPGDQEPLVGNARAPTPGWAFRRLLLIAVAAVAAPAVLVPIARAVPHGSELHAKSATQHFINKVSVRNGGDLIDGDKIVSDAGGLSMALAIAKGLGKPSGKVFLGGDVVAGDIISGNKIIVSTGHRDQDPVNKDLAQCRNVPDWHDSGGEKYDCKWYGEADARCSKSGDDDEHNGHTANTACCVCGGGQHGHGGQQGRGGQQDRISLLQAISSAPDKAAELLKDASKDQQRDREIVKVALNNNGHALKYVSEDLQADQDIVQVAVNQDPGALKYASEELQADPVMNAIASRR